MSATLRLVRQGFGVELRRRPFLVTVDGKEVATLKPNDSFEDQLDPGEHTLSVQAGQMGRSLSFEVGDEDMASFRCHAPMMWPRAVASFLVPSLGITLRRE